MLVPRVASSRRALEFIKRGLDAARNKRLQARIPVPVTRGQAAPPCGEVLRVEHG